MKNYIKIAIALLAMVAGACSYPLDENELLITTRAESYMTMFDLLDEAHATVIMGLAAIDTITDPNIGIVAATVKYGTNLKVLKPYCSLAQDAVVTPKMGAWTDFSDLLNPLTYTVISGNREVKKTYKIVITVQLKP
ncbi:MAG: hypothetical protein NT144_11430 [Bacteroidia bacterium]|nr:hypothetical protein [Bacteroidia bacterium]